MLLPLDTIGNSGGDRISSSGDNSSSSDNSTDGGDNSSDGSSSEDLADLTITLATAADAVMQAAAAGVLDGWVTLPPAPGLPYSATEYTWKGWCGGHWRLVAVQATSSLGDTSKLPMWSGLGGIGGWQIASTAVVLALLILLILLTLPTLPTIIEHVYNNYKTLA
jgi:hypothetical protein